MKERIKELAETAYCEWVNMTCVHDCREKYEELIRSALTTLYNEALEKAVSVVYGQCESDNVAQRTVDAIRKLKEKNQ